MISLPKLFITVTGLNNLDTLLTAPGNDLIRLFSYSIAISNNNEKNIGLYPTGIRVYESDTVIKAISDNVFFPMVAIINIPGTVKLEKNFGPTGMLCFSSVANKAATIQMVNGGANFTTPVAFTFSYNIEKRNS